MYKNPKVKTCKINSANLLINTSNSAVVGIDDNTYKEYLKILDDKIIDTELFDFLVENEFISDKNNFTKNHDVSNAYIHVTDRCNLKCNGCYSAGERNDKNELALDDIKKVISNLKSLNLKNIIISGGEPMIRNDLDLVLKNIREELNPENLVVITNGTINNDKLLENILKYIDVLAVSLDTYNSKCEPILRGEKIFDRIMEFIDKAKSFGINISILPTINHKNSDFIAEYTKLSKELNSEISFSLFTVKPNDNNKDFVLDKSDLEKIINYYHDHEMNVTDVPLNNSLEGKCNCKTGEELISVGTDGSLYPCHMLMEDEFKMGNLLEGDALDLLIRNTKNSYRITVDEINDCKNCEYKYLCGGGCRARAYLNTDSIEEKDPFCPMYYGFFENMFRQF